MAKLEPLAKLTSLTSLYLTGNKVGDLKAPSPGLSRLASLNLGKNQIKDLTPFDQGDAADHPGTDRERGGRCGARLTKQTELTLLMLQKNRITDLAPLVKWAKADADGAGAPHLPAPLPGRQPAVARRQDHRVAGMARSRSHRRTSSSAAVNKSRRAARRYSSPVVVEGERVAGRAEVAEKGDANRWPGRG